MAKPIITIGGIDVIERPNNRLAFVTPPMRKDQVDGIVREFKRLGSLAIQVLNEYNPKSVKQLGYVFNYLIPSTRDLLNEQEGFERYDDAAAEIFIKTVMGGKMVKLDSPDGSTFRMEGCSFGEMPAKELADKIKHYREWALLERGWDLEEPDKSWKDNRIK